jgi:putative transposon-encoded protein
LRQQREITKVIGDVMPFGTGGAHLILPKAWIGTRIIAVTKQTWDLIKGGEKAGTDDKESGYATPFGTGAHVVLGKKWLQKKVIAVTKQTWASIIKGDKDE